MKILDVKPREYTEWQSIINTLKRFTWQILTSACLIHGSGLVVEPKEGEVGQVAQALQYTGIPLGSDQRGGWPLPTVETELNRESNSKNERGPSLVDSLGLKCRYKRFLSCLGCHSRPSTKYFIHHYTLFQIICPQRPAY
jgi:hypothetical protein